MLDKLRIYKGLDVPITPKISVKQPTLSEILEFGERDYFSAVRTLTSVGADMKWQLWEQGIDYTKISDYDLFIKLIWRILGSQKTMIEEAQLTVEGQQMLADFTQEELDKLMVNPLRLILNIDLGDFILCKEDTAADEPERLILYNRKDDITIDQAVYAQMISVIRDIHGFKRNNEMPGNEITKMDLIEDARDELEAAKYKDFESILRPLISYLNVKCGLCGSDQIWNMHINQFFYDIKKAGGIKETELLLQGAYSGFASLKDVDNEKLNWFSDVM
jgi:hypothetical protein